MESNYQDTKLFKNKILGNKIKTFFSKPQNVILLLFGILVTFTTISPIVAIVKDTFTVHPGTVDSFFTGKKEGFTFYNYVDLFTGQLINKNLLTPVFNTLKLAIFTCLISILYGGFFAFLVTRTNLKFRKYLSSIFIFPYIMPQWTLAVVWKNVFNSNAICGTADGLLAATLGIKMPLWWCNGLFPSSVVLGLHYAPFAYILIGGIIMLRVTLPMIKPAILSTILLVFGSSIGSYPVPHYLSYTTLSTRYIEMNSGYTGEASILAIIRMIFGVAG